MNITITSHPGTIVLPINLFLWGNVIIYILHILEESTLGEVFVDKLKKHIWPEYSWKHFFWFNTILLSLNIVGNVLFDFLGEYWLIFPLALAVERLLNSFWHLGETLVTKKYSSGVLTGVLVWILFYFVIRFSLIQGEIDSIVLIFSVLIGSAITGMMMGSMYSFWRKFQTG